MRQTKQWYIDNWPASPNPYSASDEVFPNGQLVDEAAMLRAIAKHEREIERCTCEYDGDAGDDGRPRVYRTPKAGCPTHAEEDEA
jgi:hypothetical protein